MNEPVSEAFRPTALDRELIESLDALEADALRRRLRVVEPLGPLARIGDRPLINLAGNDYLALSGHPRIAHAVAQAAFDRGVGAGASRLVSGHHGPTAQLEHRFARFKHAQAALLLPTGYMANLALITALARPGDLVCLDKLVHASLLDAARLSGANFRTYPHLDLDRLDRLIARWRSQAQPQARALVVTDSVFSMDGDTADLPSLANLCDRHAAALIIDEAHGTGVLGPTGAGLAELQAASDRVAATVSTASKALGGLGGFVTGSEAIIETVVNRARPFIFSTGCPPTQVAAIDAALDVLADEPQRRDRLRELAVRARAIAVAQGFRPPQSLHPTPILPLITGDAASALALADHLAQWGVLAPAIRPPSVPRGAARVRLSLRCDLEDRHLQVLAEALRAWGGARAG